MTILQPTPTFRDPSGSLRFENNYAVRQIRNAARASVLEYLHSTVYRRAVERGDMVDSIVHDLPSGLVLHHPRVAVPGYPWEWTPSQWVAAAELTLSLCEEAIREGWILKDATPLNILFVGNRPVLVDVLSFEKRVPESPVWPAYGQFIRTFLLPLLMHRMLHWPLSLTIIRRDGYEPEDLYSVLTWRQRLSQGAFWPVTLPVWLERVHRGTGQQRPSLPAGTTPVAAAKVLHGRLADLRRRTRSTVPKNESSTWSNYRETLTHYTAEQAEQKRAWVREVLTQMRPERVLDLGANTGEYSALAAEMGCEVIALERDAASAERLFRMSRARGLGIQTIHADLARPTPAVGWENSESTSLLDRLEGRCDLVMMLALIHHLLLIDQIPLARIMQLCGRLTRRYIVVEWVPVGDEMYRSLMRGRDELYGDLSEADLIEACTGSFEVKKRQSLGNGRVLFLLQKNVGEASSSRHEGELSTTEADTSRIPFTTRS